MAKRSTQLAGVQHRGRPVVHTEPWEKITVVMLERHEGYIDLMSILIRMKHHKAISRAEIIRAFVEFMIRSKIDFKQFATIKRWSPSSFHISNVSRTAAAYRCSSNRACFTRSEQPPSSSASIEVNVTSRW